MPRVTALHHGFVRSLVATAIIGGLALTGCGGDTLGWTAGHHDLSTSLPPEVATPRFSPDPRTYDRSQLWAVTLSDATPGAAIYFTYDGTDPTTSSILYTGYIDVTVESTMSATTTIRAIAVAKGFSISEIASGTYNLTETYWGSCLVDDTTGQLNGDCWTQTYQGCFTGFSAQCAGSPAPYGGEACGFSVSGTSCTFIASAIPWF